MVKKNRFITIFLFVCVNYIGSQEAKVEGDAFEKIENNKEAMVKLRIVVLLEDPDKIAFMVENIGKHDVLIHTFAQVNNEVKIKKPDGTFWKNPVSKRTGYMKFKPGQNLIHTTLPAQDFFKAYGLTSPGYYEITWIVEGKWESNTFIVYVQEPVKVLDEEQLEKSK